MHIIGYDISDNLRRTQVLRLLRGRALHWQESFFVLDIAADERERLYRTLREMLDLRADSLLMAPVQPALPGAGLLPACEKGGGIYWLEQTIWQPC